MKGLKEVIWVVEKTSRHVDWTDVPEVFGGKLDVSAWHELVQEKGFPNPDVLPENNKSRPGNIVFIWQDAANPQGEVVEFTQGVRYHSPMRDGLTGHKLTKMHRT